MPPHYRAWRPQVAIEDLEDLYDIDAYNDALYGPGDPEDDDGEWLSNGDEEGGAVAEEDEGDGAEGSRTDEEEEEEDEEEEEPEGVQLVAGDCGPPPQARVSGAAAERANTSTCPVCMEPWTSQGLHRISCIPCGHVYGRSCLEKWLTQSGNRRVTQSGNQRATCPQCGKRFRQKDIINLYAQEVAIPNSELEKEISQLREEIGSLKKVVRHDKMFEEMTKLQKHNAMEQGIIDGVSSKRQKVSEHSYRAANLEPSTLATINFSLQNELHVDGARVISIDASNQIILVSGRATAVGAEYILTKIAMWSNHEVRKIHLPPDTKAVRDMCILPDGSAIFTSLGRKLSLFSMTTDSVTLNWDLPAPGWSCAVGASGSQHIYAGLQNGMVLVFDIRQTARPLHSMVGLSTNPVHTLHSVIDDGGYRKVLSASAVGPCMWDADNNQSRPYLLTGMGDQRVCISLACAAPSIDLMVASFRPKVVDPSGDAAAASQVYLSQTPTRSGTGKSGHHSLIRRTGNTTNMCFSECNTWYANVSELRMSKSAIIPYGDNQHLFAYGDESLRGVRTWQLPSFLMHADLCTHREPILDLRYAESQWGPGGGRYLGCLSEEKLQVFRVN